jgi:hypothetical protein
MNWRCSILALMLPAVAGAAEALRWEQTADRLALYRGDQVVWQFGLDAIYQRPHFHPLTLPDGREFTDCHPKDHPWHLGLWFSWKKVNGLEYWQSGWRNVKEQIPLPPAEALQKGMMGLVRVESLALRAQPDFHAEIVTVSTYRPKADAAPVLRETRMHTVTPPGTDGGYRIDTALRFDALADVVCNQYDYGGLHLRLKNEIPKTTTGDQPGGPLRNRSKPPPRSRWAVVSLENGAASLCLLDHPGNPHHPPVWWIPGNTLGPVAIATGDICIPAGELLRLHYRLLIYPGRRLAQEIEADWSAFAQTTREEARP